MTDFVQALEQQLHQAAVRQEQAGAVRRVALPRVRIAVPNLVGAALATAALALAIAGLATVFLGSGRQEAALPAELEGQWRLPVELGVQGGARQDLSGDARGENSLLLLAEGASRCEALGVDSACYVIDDTVEGAIQWGRFDLADEEITFTATNDSTAGPATYRWRIENRALVLVAVEPDPDTDRAFALTSGPLTRVGGDQSLPEGWTAKPFTSKRYTYTIRIPARWSALAATTSLPVDGLALPTSDAADRLSADPRGVGRPSVAIAAHAVDSGTTLAAWTKELDDHLRTTRGCDAGPRQATIIGGVRATLIVYPNCHHGHQQWAMLVYRGQGYQFAWSGEAGAQDRDGKLFRAMLDTLEF